MDFKPLILISACIFAFMSINIVAKVEMLDIEMNNNIIYGIPYYHLHKKKKYYYRLLYTINAIYVIASIVLFFTIMNTYSAV